MPIPVEIQTLQTLLQRQDVLEQRRRALAADTAVLDRDFEVLYGAGTLGVTEDSPNRYVHLKAAPNGKIRFIHVFWVALVNGVNRARAELLDVDEDQGGRP